GQAAEAPQPDVRDRIRADRGRGAGVEREQEHRVLQEDRRRTGVAKMTWRCAAFGGSDTGRMVQRTGTGTTMSKSDMTRRGFLLRRAAARAAAGIAKAADAPAKKGSTETPTTASSAGGSGRPKRQPKPLSSTTKTKYSDIRVACIGIAGRGRADLEAMVKA